MTTQIVINNLFTKANRVLDGSVKGRVLDFITKLQHDPSAPALDLKRPQGAIDPRVRTARVNDSWRAVLFELPDGAGFVLASVKPHDDAYIYASNLRMQINAATGALELIDQLAIKGAVAPALRERGSGRPAPARPLLAGISTTTLAAFGLTQDVIDTALAITDEEQFEELCDALPAIQGCALLDLRAGKDPDEVYADLIGAQPIESVDTNDVAAALTRATSHLQFATGTSEELLAAIEGDLQAWRVWLHPLQRTLAYRDGFNGPFRVTGGAGTGKTVTALHRARHLAERAHATDASGPVVLVATYTRNLADALGLQFRELAGPEIAPLVDVVNLDALASRILKRHNPVKLRLVSPGDPEARAAWQIAASGSEYDPDFLADEWLDVVLANGVSEQAAYLRVPRPGRGTPLNRAKRIEVWALIEKAQQHLAVAGVMTHAQAASAAADIVAADPSLRYRHGIIDEAQDLHPAHWRLVRALVPPGPDDLFIVGDAHQRIYGKPLVLSRYGIETRGRSRRLTINYRTSEQILRWCLSVMNGAAIDDLEGAEDTLVGARSAFSGPVPTSTSAATTVGEDADLVAQVRAWLAEGFQPSDIGVLSRERTGVDAALAALKSAGVPAVLVDRTDTQAAARNVQVMTMHRAKGLEFTCVAITRLGRRHYPPAFIAGLPEQRKELQLAQERALLYVAGSRARERLALLHVGTAPRLNAGA